MSKLPIDGAVWIGVMALLMALAMTDNLTEFFADWRRIRRGKSCRHKEFDASHRCRRCGTSKRLIMMGSDRWERRLARPLLRGHD